MDDLRKALETIALRNGEGVVPDDLLIKACDAYKVKSDFLDDYDYHICVAKSLSDYIHGLEPSEEICKALVPGQTKVVDGIVYIYTSTPNAKTRYDWRVLKSAKQVGRQVDSSKVDSKQKYVNELFPRDLSTLKTIKQLGGSTGAKLVEDAKGNQYVMKRGNNTSNGHVKSEYLTNQLYEILGLRVPDFELYDDGGEAVLLSRFIPMTRVPSTSDYPEMAKGFAVDALLANWDVYQNDNCLVDSAGRIIRVDNGGALEYRAQGAKKNFGDDVVDWDSMIKYNPSVLSTLSDQEKIDQINSVLEKKDDVFGFLEVSNQNALGATFYKRFKSLESIKNDLEAKILKSARKVSPRQLKPEAEMYRDFTEDELNDFWTNLIGADYRSKIQQTSKNGWELLDNICQSRGFNARPRVVDETEYWNTVSQVPYQMFRGLTSGWGGTKTADDFADDFRYNDNCYYGTMGVHGCGIYFHVNDGDSDKSNTKTTYRKSDAYRRALLHSGRSGAILEACLEPDAKVALVPDLQKEIENLTLYDKAAADALDKELNDLLADLANADYALFNITQTTIDNIHKEMHWDEDSLVMSQTEIDNTDWGNVNENGEPEYPSFEDFVKGKMFDWVTKNGGKVKEKQPNSDVYVFSLPNSKETFMISRFQYENNAIKRKNAFAKAYNYPVRRFQDWLMNNHYKVIQKRVDREISDLGDAKQKAQAEVNRLRKKVDAKEQELTDLKKYKDPNKDILSGIYEDVVHNSSKEAIGVYAAIKGYDAIIEPHGNGGSNSFMIVLNRSKVIVKK